MITLITLIVFGIAAAFFATQNPQSTTIVLGEYTLSNIPVYLVVLLSVLLGILVSWIINLINTISSSLTIRGKEGTIHATKRENADLLKKVHTLELENTRLKTKLGEEKADDRSL